MADTAKTLIVVHSQLEKYATLRDAIKGAVYLGCPHSSTPDSRDVLYDRALAILQLQSELSSRTLKRLKAGSELTDLCKAYDDMGGHVPILTIYEQKPTKQGSRAFLFKHNNHDVSQAFTRKLGLRAGPRIPLCADPVRSLTNNSQRSATNSKTSKVQAS